MSSAVSWSDVLVQFAKQQQTPPSESLRAAYFKVDEMNQNYSTEAVSFRCLSCLCCCFGKYRYECKEKQRFYEKLEDKNLVAFALFGEQILSYSAPLSQTLLHYSSIQATPAEQFQQNYREIAAKVLTLWQARGVPVEDVNGLEALPMGSSCNFGMAQGFIIDYLQKRAQGADALEAVKYAGSRSEKGATPEAELFEISFRAHCKEVQPKYQESWDGWLEMEAAEKAAIVTPEALQEFQLQASMNRINLLSMLTMMRIAIPLKRANLEFSHSTPFPSVNVNLVQKLQTFLAELPIGCYLINFLPGGGMFSMVFIKQEQGDHYMMGPELATVRAGHDECADVLYKFMAFYLSRSKELAIVVFHRVELGVEPPLPPPSYEPETNIMSSGPFDDNEI